jgi:hypothetical protein
LYFNDYIILAKILIDSNFIRCDHCKFGIGSIFPSYRKKPFTQREDNTINEQEEEDERNKKEQITRIFDDRLGIDPLLCRIPRELYFSPYSNHLSDYTKKMVEKVSKKIGTYNYLN